MGFGRVGTVQLCGSSAGVTFSAFDRCSMRQVLAAKEQEKVWKVGCIEITRVWLEVKSCKVEA